MSTWKRKQSAWWERALAMTTATGISLQQFILMALSVIALDTYWGDAGRDHAPTGRPNHQRRRPRLQHSGGHGGGRLLPWEHNTTQAAARLRVIDTRRTGRTLAINACVWMMQASVRGIYFIYTELLQFSFTFLHKWGRNYFLSWCA